MFEDNNGGAGAPLDNLTEDDIVLCDYDEVKNFFLDENTSSSVIEKVENVCP